MLHNRDDDQLGQGMWHVGRAVLASSEMSQSDDDETMPPPAIPSVKSHTDLLRMVSPGLRRRTVAALTLVACLGLAACAASRVRRPQQGSSAPSVAWMPGSSQLYSDVRPTSAWDFLLGPEVRHAVVHSLMRVGADFLGPSEERSVQTSVTYVWGNASQQLQVLAPEAVKALKELHLGSSQQEALLSSVHLLSDPHVHTIGLDVARAIHGSLFSDRERLRLTVEERLQPRLDHIASLRDGIVDDSLLKLWKEEGGRPWDLTLEQENIRIMQTAGGKYISKLDGPHKVNIAEKLYGIASGAVEEFRALLSMLKPYVELQGGGLQVPAFATLLDGGIGSGPVSCELITMDDNKADLVQAMFCPLRFGTQGSEALRAAADMKSKQPSSLMISISPGAAGAL